MTSALAALIEGMLDAVWLVDAASLRVVAANAAAGTLMGVAADELCGREIAELAATPEDLCFWDDVTSGLADHIESDTLARRVNGGTVAVTRRVSRLELAPGAPLFIVTLHDRSEQRRIEDELEERLAELSATLESTADGILVTDLAGNIRSFNHRFATLWDVPDALLKRRDDDAVLAWMRRSVVDPACYMRRLASIDESTTLQTSDTVSLHCGTVLERVTLPQRSRGRPIGRVYSFRDITERVEAMRRIDTLSHTEPLTGLPNRRVLADRVAFALALAAREGTPFALLLVNLDHFKQVNDTLGRAVGDRVLIDVGQRLKSCLRQVDTVACLGGDEFVLLLHAADPAGTEITARRVLDAVQCPFTESGVNFTVTCSIGVALHPCDGANLDELLRHS
ncbi:MAG TPA: diguanylate cyclase, partial [Albitalea sp.]|nr:diguanylate cyclase [Albitalea sp.]